jgi:hypothetical protein
MLAAALPSFAPPTLQHGTLPRTRPRATCCTLSQTLLKICHIVFATALSKIIFIFIFYILCLLLCRPVVLPLCSAVRCRERGHAQQAAQHAQPLPAHEGAVCRTARKECGDAAAV